MGKNTISAIFLMLLASATTFAGPEKYEPLKVYTEEEVKMTGPKEEVVLDADGVEVAKALYTYNDRKQIVKVEFYKGNTRDGHLEYSYEKNRLAEEHLYNAEGKVIEKVNYKYDKSGNVSSYVVEDGEGNEMLKWVFSWSGKTLRSGARLIEGQITERFTISGNGDLFTQDIYTGANEKAGSIRIDAQNGQVTRRTRNDFTGNFSIVYSYDAKGRIIRMEFYAGNGEQSNLQKSHHYRYQESAVNAPLKVSGLK